MSARSSLSSGSGRLPGTDIIDLDRYMRAAVRPGVSPSERLVVDAGGFDRKPERWQASNSASNASAVTNSDMLHMKRFSHDSGLSDDSKPQQRHRSHRRVTGDVTTQRCRGSVRGRGSATSLSAFRTACERTLREQQEQIARVAQLCEKLGERQIDRRSERIVERRNDRRNERVKCVKPQPERQKPERPKPERPKQKRPKPECSTSSIESSNITLSTHNSKERNKDKHRTDECTTYKIIMTKLDELSRLFAAKRPAPPVTLTTKPVSSGPHDASSGSVSVSDKIVATEPDIHGCITSRQMSPTLQTVLSPRQTERRLDLQHAYGTGSTPMSATGEEMRQKDRLVLAERRRDMRPLSESRRLAVTRANYVEIAPPHERRPNVVTERVVERDFESDCNSCDQLANSFDLDDPLELYAQAKRLQNVHPEPRRSRSEDRKKHNERAFDMRGFSVGGRFGEESLCARCRVYWRAIRDCFTTQLFCRPGRAYAC